MNVFKVKQKKNRPRHYTIRDLIPVLDASTCAGRIDVPFNAEWLWNPYPNPNPNEDCGPVGRLGKYLVL